MEHLQRQRMCNGKSPGRPNVSEVNIARIKIAFQRNSTKSTRRASGELQLPTTKFVVF
ncbi:hypothetical protein C0J52_09738 [Blattella germanica]|nr:hypothetical protein C0J52_09738 [Blattella germanica]